jgi:uncharacterized membrane protein YkgB
MTNLEEITKIISAISLIILVIGMVLIGFKYIEYKKEYIKNDTFESKHMSCLYYGFITTEIYDNNITCLNYNKDYDRSNDWRRELDKNES